MRSTIIAAAFAASALAVPYANPDVVTAYDTDVVYVTNVVTVTQGAPAPTTAAAETTVAAADAAPPSYDQGGNWGGNNGGWHWPHKHKTHKSKKTRTKTQTTQQAPAPSPPPSYEPTTAAPEPTQEPEPQPPTVVSGYTDIVVAHHNVHRTNHSAPNVEWDAGLASTAQKIAAGCVYAHDVEMDGGGYGQNIAAGVEAGNVSAIITNLFYNGEIGYYGNMYGGEPSMDLFEKWGHFSQIIWKNTKSVGCATQYCPNGLGNTGSNVAPYFTVCNYSPPGNYGGEYAANVLSPKAESTVDWNYGL